MRKSECLNLCIDTFSWGANAVHKSFCLLVFIGIVFKKRKWDLADQTDLNFENWKYVLTVAETIQEDLKTDQICKESLKIYLDSLEEVLGGQSDPLRDFQGYALLSLCRSISKTLAKI